MSLITCKDNPRYKKMISYKHIFLYKTTKQSVFHTTEDLTNVEKTINFADVQLLDKLCNNAFLTIRVPLRCLLHI